MHSLGLVKFLISSPDIANIDGLTAGTTDDHVSLKVQGEVVQQPNAVARALAKFINPALLGVLPVEQAQVVQWQSFSTNEDVFGKAVELNQHLETHSFLVGNALTLADLQVYWALAPGVQASFPGPLGGLVHLMRWFDQIQNCIRLSFPQNDESLLPAKVPLHSIYKPISMPVYSKKKESEAKTAAQNHDGKKKKEEGEKAVPSEEGKKAATGKQQLQQQKQKKENGGSSKDKPAALPSGSAAQGAEAPEELNPNFLDIRVGVITKAWKHPEAEKLYCEEIDVGEESVRQIASGLRHFYASEAELEGRKVLVLANLKPRALVGFKSHGMVLCASNADHTEVKFVEVPASAKAGDRVVFDGYEGEPLNPNQLAKKKVFEKLAEGLITDDKGVCNYKGAAFVVASTGDKCTAPLTNAHVS